MANIKKTFNFRNGVQVDEDNLIVNATGLVGIGTTIPTEALDVRGTAKVVGLVTSNEGFIGIFTAHTSSLGTVALSTSIIGAGVSIKSGIITSNSATGLVTYYGDARFLQGMPTSQWEDTDAGFGVTSIFNTGGTVGIATTNPQFSLQVGNNVNGGEKGVGISSVGNIKASGIITATTFSGNFNGSVDSSALNATGISTFNNDVVTGAGATVGIGTTVFFGDNIQANFGDQSDLKIYHDSPTDQSVILSSKKISLMSGIGIEIEDESGKQLADFTKGGASRLFYNANGDATDLKFETTNEGVLVSGGTTTGTLSVTGVSTLGVSTFTGPVSFGASVSFGDDDFAKFGHNEDLKIYHTGAHSFIEDSGQGNLVIKGSRVDIQDTSGNELLSAEGGQYVRLNHGANERLKTSANGVTITPQLDTTNIVASGVITATTVLNSPLVGVGTDDPSTDIQVRNASAAQIRVTSDSNAAIVSIGREPSSGNGNNAALRYGNESVAFDYSTNKSLDILNYSTGNINFNLDATNQNSNIGDFYWSKYNNPIMTLTSGGNLGIGITLPEYKLHVAGVSTFTGDVYGGNNLTIGGDLTVGGSFQLNELIGNVTGNITGSINSDSAVGMNTVSLLESDGIGIGLTSGGKRLRINNNNGTQFYVSNSGQVGVCTDLTFTNIKLAVPNAQSIFSAVGVGTVTLRSALDFSAAGATPNDPNGAIANRFMIPPLLDNAQRVGLSTVPGAMIYNTDTNKLNVYNGTAWREVTDGAV